MAAPLPGRVVMAVTDLSESHLVLARLTDALFCSELKTGDLPTGRRLAAVIRASLKSHRTWDSCTRAVAAAFAEDPRAAEERELWCRQLAEAVLGAGDIHLSHDCMD